jgi:hypothetical protein
MNRVDHIVAFFEANMNRFEDDDLTIKLIRVRPANWVIQRHADPTQVHSPFGYMPPTIALGELVFIYCPEIVDAQTGLLTDSDFIDYLLFISTHVTMHIEYYDVPDEEAERLIDSRMYDLSARTMGIVNRVHLRALDPT